jgi:WD40 repeat protein
VKKTIIKLALALSQAAIAQAQEIDVFPVASVNPDRQSITVEIENFSNFDWFCDRISTQLIYRSNETANNLEESIHSRGIWIPKQSTLRFTDGRATTARLRRLFKDANIDVVKNDSVVISSNVKCSEQVFKPMLGKLAVHGAYITSSTARRDGAVVATAGNDQKVKLWNASNGSLIKELVFADPELQAIFAEGDDSFFVIQKNLGIVSKYDATSFDPIFEINAGEPFRDTAVISKDGSFLSLTASRSLYLLQTATGAWIKLPNSTVSSDSFNKGKFQFNPQGSKFAYAAFSVAAGVFVHTVYVLDLKQFPLIRQIDSIHLNATDASLQDGFVTWSLEGNSVIFSAVGKNGRGYMQKRGYYGNALSSIAEVQVATYMGLPLPDGRVAFMTDEYFTDLYRAVKIWNPTTNAISFDNSTSAWYSNPLVHVPGSQNFLSLGLSDASVYDPIAGTVQAAFDFTGESSGVRILPQGSFIYSHSGQEAFVMAMPAVANVAVNVTEPRPTQAIAPALTPTPLVTTLNCPSGKKSGETSHRPWGGVYLCDVDGKDKFQGCDSTQALVWNAELKTCQSNE